MKKIWFSSDWHLSHRAIIEYDNRPFKDIYEMDETIIDNYNSLVGDKDDFYFIGDLSFATPKVTDQYLSRLKGNLYFIAGNHDHKKGTIPLYKKHGVFLGNLEEIKVNNQYIVLCHYAMRIWNRSHYGSYQIYGHSHHNLPDDPNSLSMDVGCNGWDYKPVEFEQIKEIMSKKTWKPIDHHI